MPSARIGRFGRLLTVWFSLFVAFAGAPPVAGAQPSAPAVSSVTLDTPQSGDTFGLNEIIRVWVGFDETLTVTGSPQLALSVGTYTRQATYIGGSSSLVFGYTVQAVDSDPDGISITANALTLNGGTIRDADGNNAALGLGAHAVANDRTRKVNGNTDNAPTVRAVVLDSTPTSGDTYGAEENIWVGVEFYEAVTVTGTPQLALSVGTFTRQANYSSSDSGGRWLQFVYTTQPGDTDADGISIGAGALTLNSGTIQDSGGNAATLSLSGHTITNAAGHKADGSIDRTPTVTQVGFLSSPQGGDTYGVGETIWVRVLFDEPVTVTGTPQLALSVGTFTRQAAYSSGSGRSALFFNYTVQATDTDSDGIGIGAGALTLNSGTIQDSGGNAATLSLSDHTVTNAAGHKVDGSIDRAPVVTNVEILSSPQRGDTYGVGEAIRVEVSFNEPVTVTGAPQLAVSVGTFTRQAAYSSGSGRSALFFSYAVQATDTDSDGIGIGAGALTLNSGTIQDSGGNAATLSLSGHTVTNAAGHKVDGSIDRAPVVTNVEILSSPQRGDTYDTGEAIRVRVGFDEPVTVTGTPQLALSVGTFTRQAAYSSGSGRSALFFDYTVQATDTDSDGIGIGAGALTLNSGTIQDSGGNAATLSLSGHTVTNAAGHKVDGSTDTLGPSVSGVTIRNPQSGDTFGVGEFIEIWVGFDEDVVSTGSGSLALMIGSNLRQAPSVGLGSRSLGFRYLVRATDLDTDGISIAADALTRVSGTLRDAAGNAATLNLRSHAVTNDANYKVNGSIDQVPGVVGIVVQNLPQNGATYRRNEVIEIAVFFGEGVTITGTPRLALKIGTNTRRANYFSGGAASLLFRYQVRASDTDIDGISIAANALTLNSGTIRDAGGNAATLSLSGHTISNDATLKVDGSLGRAPRATGVYLSSSPQRGDTYGAGEAIRVEVSFDEPVRVSGTPRLALAIGTFTRQASYASGAGNRALVFAYTVQAADADPDGIALAAGALTLNGGTIRGTGNDAATLSLSGQRILDRTTSAPTAHRVDGSVDRAPTVTGVAVYAGPQSGETFGVGETIRVEVGFDEAVTVSGTPQVALTIGARTRPAAYASGSGGRFLYFAYTVVAADRDANGLGIAADALTLNAGTIRDAGSNAAALGLGRHAFASDANYKVDGSITAASGAGHAPADEAAFDAGAATVKMLTTNDCIMEYDTTGSRVTSVCAGGPRSGGYTYANTGSDTGRLTIAWDQGDRCVYNLTYTSVAAGRMAYTCRRSEGATVDFVAVPRTASGAVPAVQFVAFQSVLGPASGGDTYGRGETIWVLIGFDRRVILTGEPQVALTIGARTRQAAYFRGAGREVLSFRYVVQAEDVDTDGISIPPNALTLNNGGGILTFLRGRTWIRVEGVDAVVPHAAVAADPNRKVDGGVSASVTLRPARLDVPEGSTGQYSVVLDMEPAGTVTVSISSDTNEVVPTPDALTFTTMTWATAQTVTVAAGEDGDAQDDRARLGHTIGRDGAENVRAAALRVTVEDDDEQIVVAPGTTTQEPVGSRTLTVIAAADVPAGVRITKPETLAADVTVTVAPPAADQRVDSGQFRLGEEADARTVVDIAVTAVPPGGLEVCLPVSVALRREAGGAVLLLLHYDGSRWTAVAESRDLGTRVCAPGATDFSPFAIGYVPRRTAGPVDSPPPSPAGPPGPTDPEPPARPSCGDAVVPAQVYRAGEVIAAVVLPAATGGTGPLRYGVGPEIPAGLTYTAPADPTATGGVLTGVPTAAQAATAYTLTATEADGVTTALLTFTIRVAGPGQIRAQAGMRTYALGGRTVTVTQAAGTLAGVELTLPGRLAEDVAITLAPPGAAVPLAGGRYRFGPADAQAAVAVAVTPVPAGGLDVCVPVSAGVRAAARERAVQLVRYVGGKWTRWARIAGAEAEAERVCGTGMTWFGPLAAGYPNTVPTFGEQTIAAQTGMVAATLAPVALPAAEGGDGPVRYALAPALPTGLSYTLPTESAAGAIAGVPMEAQPPTEYTLTATDVDGDAATLAFTLAVEREPVQVSIGDATATEGAAVEFPVTLSRAVAKPVTVEWTAGAPGSATPGEDYRAEPAGRLTLAAGTTTGTLAVPTLDDRRVEPTETFTVTVTLPADPLFESADATAEGRIEDDDTEQARKRSVGMVLAGVGRTLATDAVDVIGDRFMPPPTTPHATVGGQALSLRRDGDTARWRHAAGVAYGVARALGVEVGSPLEGGAGEFGQVRGAAWSALTRHLRAPHAAAAPLSAWDPPGAFGAPGLDGLSSAAWGTPNRASAAPSFPPAPSTFRHAQGTAGSGAGQGLAPAAPSIPPPSPSTSSGTGRGLEPAPDPIRGGGSPGWDSPADTVPFGRAPFPGLAGYGTGLGQGGFDRAHAATPQALKVGTFRAPVQFRRVSGAEVLSQSAFEIPLSRAAADPPVAVRMAKADPTAPMQPGETAPQAAAAAWTLWGRGTASGFDGQPKDDFSMDGNVFTGYLGLDYRLQPNVLLGLAVAHSQGDVDYETTDVTKGAVDLTLTSVLPYAHWSPRPGLGVWGLFGAGWGDLQLRDEAGKVKTDLEMLMAAVGARQEVLTWRRLDVALKADAFLTELEAGSDDRLPKTAGDAQRLRLMVEGRTAWAVSGDSHLTPIFEIGGRWDGGKAETGVGAELGGGFEYAHTKLGLGIEARGRYLLAHQKSAFDEWGASLTLKLDPGEAKRGLWLALAPVWGAEASQVEQLWGSADVLRAGAETDAPPGLSPAQVEFDIGYGLVTYEGAGLLTTYGGVSMTGPDSRGYRLGGRIELGEWIDLSVEGERTTQGGAAAHQVALYGHLGW